MELYTVQLSQWREVGKRGLLLLNTTVKSGQREFAPTWEMVIGIKKGTLTPEEYTEQYKALMQESLREHSAYWERLLHEPNLAIACYCRPGVFCHRHILADIFERECERRGIPFIRRSEILPDPSNKGH